MYSPSGERAIVQEFSVFGRVRRLADWNRPAAGGFVKKRQLNPTPRSVIAKTPATVAVTALRRVILALNRSAATVRLVRVANASSARAVPASSPALISSSTMLIV